MEENPKYLWLRVEITEILFVVKVINTATGDEALILSFNITLMVLFALESHTWWKNLKILFIKLKTQPMFVWLDLLSINEHRPNTYYNQ